MLKKLYVGSLSYNTTEDSLRDYFAGAGEVESVAVITDRMTGRSKGFGFVEMATEEGARAAIEMFDGKDFEGFSLRVNEARPKEEGARRFGGNNRGGYGRN
jgi:RNA recognition motif-containing protein